MDIVSVEYTKDKESYTSNINETIDFSRFDDQQLQLSVRWIPKEATAAAPEQTQPPQEASAAAPGQAPQHQEAPAAAPEQPPVEPEEVQQPLQEEPQEVQPPKETPPGPAVGQEEQLQQQAEQMQLDPPHQEVQPQQPSEDANAEGIGDDLHSNSGLTEPMTQLTTGLTGLTLIFAYSHPFFYFFFIYVYLYSVCITQNLYVSYHIIRNPWR